MKKIEIKGKLSLNKSTIANLNNEQMTMVKGGIDVVDDTIAEGPFKSLLKHCHYPTCKHDDCANQTRRDIGC